MNIIFKYLQFFSTDFYIYLYKGHLADGFLI